MSRYGPELVRRYTVPMALDLLAENLRLNYADTRGGSFSVFNIPRLEIPAGAHVGITGPSGSGKTSLLYVLTGIERPTSGSIRWGDVAITDLSERERDRWRRDNIGFIFQDFHLLPAMSPVNNVLVPYTFGRWSVPAEIRQRAADLLDQLGAPKDRHAVSVLSRGEQQRVALARALLNRPGLIVADEPTASLDAASGQVIINLLFDMAKQTGATLLSVTHDPHLIERFEVVYRLQEQDLVRFDKGTAGQQPVVSRGDG